MYPEPGFKPIPKILPNGELTPAAREEELRQAVEGSACSPSQLARLGLPPREAVLGTWFRQGDLGFIYGPRGLGKTWLAMHIGCKIAEGGKVASWEAPRPRQVLYIDGEMPLDGLLQRHQGLSSGPDGKILYMQHEALFHNYGQMLNLADPTWQRVISKFCDDKGIEVLFLDNLSCLFAGIKENDADSWELVLPWLLDLRRKRVAVVFVAHAGRNGCMRGTSRREDAAFWILQLTAPIKGEMPEEGARFLCRFDKIRNATEVECPPMEWTFGCVSNGRINVDSKPVTGLEKFRHWIESGLTSASDIALEMGITKGQVSKLAKLAMEQGWLRRDGRDYVLVTPRPPTVFSAAEAKEAAFGSSN